MKTCDCHSCLRENNSENKAINSMMQKRICIPIYREERQKYTIFYIFKIHSFIMNDL